jgi:hypothetical protein
MLKMPKHPTQVLFLLPRKEAIPIPKMINAYGNCQGCGAKPEDPECACEWAATCNCGAWDSG